MSLVSTTSGTLVPIHWNDRFYEATCPECGEDVYADNQSEMSEALDRHC